MTNPHVPNTPKPNPVQILKSIGYLHDIRLENLQGVNFNNIDASGLGACWCGCPEHGSQEIAESDPDTLVKYLNFDHEHCIHLIEMHKRLLNREACHEEEGEEAGGRGSFPFACHDEYPDNHSASYYLDFDAFPSQYTRKVKDSELDRLMQVPVWGTREELFDRYTGRTMLHVSMSLMRRSFLRTNVALFQVDKKSDANIVITSKPIRGSVIGYAYFNDGTCGDQVMQYIDSTYSPPLSPCATLITHETGHNLNLQHTKAYATTIMSYSPKYPFVGFSTGEDDYDRRKDVSIPVLVKFFDSGVIADPRIPTGPSFPEPSDWPKVGGEIWIDTSKRTGDRIIKGTPTITIDGKAWPYIVRSIGGDRFILEPNVLQGV